MMSGARLASSTACSTSGRAGQPRGVHAPAQLGRTQLGFPWSKRQGLARRVAFGEWRAHVSEKQQSATGAPPTDEELLSWAEIDTTEKSSPHSESYREFVDAQLEVVGHAFGYAALNVVVYLRTTESFVSGEAADRLRLTRVSSWPITKPRAPPWAKEDNAQPVEQSPRAEAAREPSYKNELMLFSPTRGPARTSAGAGTIAYSESLLLSQRAVQLSTGSLVIPMSREGVLLGLVVAERNALAGRPAWAPSGAPWSSPGMSAGPNSPWPLSSETFTSSQKRSLQALATSLSLVWAMDQRNKLLLRANGQTRTKLNSYISESRKPLAAIRTLGGILERQFRPGESPRDLASAIQEQGSQLSDLAAELQIALYSDNAAGLLPEPAGEEGNSSGERGLAEVGGGGGRLSGAPERAESFGGDYRALPGYGPVDAELGETAASMTVTDVTPHKADSGSGSGVGGAGTQSVAGSATAAPPAAADPVVLLDPPALPPLVQQQQRPGSADLVAPAAPAPPRVTHPRPHAASEHCSVPFVLRPLLGAMDGIARSSRVTLVADVPEDREHKEPHAVAANVRDVKRVLSLILETALQQTPPGGKMEVHVSRQRTLEGQVVLLEVLCRSTKGSSAKAAGTSSWVADGLALASSLAIEIGGSVVWDSGHGAGARGTEARVALALPAAPDDDSE